MPFIAETLIPKKVILITVSGVLTSHEIGVGTQRAESLMTNGEPPVHTIIDITNVTEYPLTVSSIFEKTPYMYHPNLGYTVFVGVNTLLLHIMVRAVAQVAGIRFERVSSIEHALDYLRSKDAAVGPEDPLPAGS